MENIFKALHTLNYAGREVIVRGLKTKEMLNAQYLLAPRERFMCFDHRKLRLDYIKQEFLWYLVGDRFDASIGEVAGMWKQLINKDGSINSNYGYSIFNHETAGRHSSNFARVVSTLLANPLSRRAVITILNNDYLNSETLDYPCTCYLYFMIRNNTLGLIVRMRSQDAIYGMGNDAPFFSFLQELMYVTLKGYPQFEDLELGEYLHTADSFHVYEKHFEMFKNIIVEPKVSSDWHQSCPKMTTATPNVIWQLQAELIKLEPDLSALAGKDQFVDWLLQRDDPKTLVTRRGGIKQ